MRGRSCVHVEHTEGPGHGTFVAVVIEEADEDAGLEAVAFVVDPEILQ
jgi:hypothetical protein